MGWHIEVFRTLGSYTWWFMRGLEFINLSLMFFQTQSLNQFPGVLWNLILFWFIRAPECFSKPKFTPIHNLYKFTGVLGNFIEAHIKVDSTKVGRYFTLSIGYGDLVIIFMQRYFVGLAVQLQYQFSCCIAYSISWTLQYFSTRHASQCVSYGAHAKITYRCVCSAGLV